MSILSWLWSIRFGPATKRSRKPRRRGAPRRPAACPLNVECLEDRCLLSLFGPPAPFPVSPVGSSEPTGVAVGDFNRDGIPDLAVANFENNTVGVLLGNGNGTFQTPTAATTIGVGNGPRSVAVGDFNRDGIPDLAGANAVDGTVSVVLGNGNGTFRGPFPATTIAVGNGPDFVAVGDFNRDGIPDLAVTNLDGTLNVLLGNGNGSFRSTGLPVVALPSVVAVGDFNGDGIPDLAVASGVANGVGGIVSVLLGNGDGTFQPAQYYEVSYDPFSLAVGDFNRDGIADLAVANVGGDSVSVLLGNGDGTFRGATSYPAGGGPLRVAVADFNRDGIADLALANFDGTLSVLLGNGDGTFQAATAYRIDSSRHLGVAVGDFNGDGAPDLAVTDFASGAVDVLLNQAPVTATALSASANPAVAGQLVTLTATVTQAVPASVKPTGIVIFEENAPALAPSGASSNPNQLGPSGGGQGVGIFGGGQVPPPPAPIVLGTGTVNASGTATFSTFSLLPGDHAITAVYQGDPNFTASTSPLLNEVIDQDTTTTSLAVSNNPVIAGQPLTLTASVAGAAPGFGPPTGSVLFLDGPATVGSGSLAGGVATFTTAALAAGTHALTAVYVGDGHFTGSSTPSALAAVVNNPAPVVTGLGPAAVPEGSPGFTLTLTGSSFVSGATVQWNGTPLTVTAGGGTQVQATVPASLLAEEGTAVITVTNPGPGGGGSLPQTFTIADAGLAASGVNLLVFVGTTATVKNFNGAVAAFTDANLAAVAGDFKAIITWDNGTADFGVVTGAGPGNTGPFTVTGAHTCTKFANAHTVSVTIFDKGGTSVTVTDNVIDPPAPDPTPLPAGGPAASPAVLPVDEPLASLEAAAQARHRHQARRARGHHPTHHPRPHKRGK